MELAQKPEDGLPADVGLAVGATAALLETNARRANSNA
jgi:hypothetical protein